MTSVNQLIWSVIYCIHIHPLYSAHTPSKLQTHAQYDHGMVHDFWMYKILKVLRAHFYLLLLILQVNQYYSSNFTIEH